MTAKELDALTHYPVEKLVELGLRRWDDERTNKGVLYLLPDAWYSELPDGYIFTNINGKEFPFKKGVTDDDTRFGMLAFGIFVRKPALRKRRRQK